MEQFTYAKTEAGLSLEEIRNCFAEDGITMTYNHLNVHIVENRTKEK